MPPIDGEIARLPDADLLVQAGAASAGRILIRGDLGRACVAVVDTNGDGAFLATVSFHLDDDGVWREAEWGNSAILGQGRVHGVSYLYGRAPAGTQVEIAPHGRVQQVPVNEAGWWLYMAETGDGEPPPDLP